MLKFIIVLFEGFETLDVFGPVEILGALPEKYELGFYSVAGGLVSSTQNVRVDTTSLESLQAELQDDYFLFLPGGMGTRKEVEDVSFIEAIARLARDAKTVLTVCTGSALLAKTGLLKNLKATSNKRAFEWVASVAQDVKWVGKARWVRDGKFYTSSGVSAGMDMTLGFIADTEGTEAAENIARNIEYIWNKDSEQDPFAVQF